jgi:hypothetical protein
MTIKFKCPHCQKPLGVKDHLAGKKAPCPSCKQTVTIPAPVSQPADLEAFAASAFADQPAAAAAPKETTRTIEFTCLYCDELVKVSADLGGKQAPCPACKRIVKVPLPKDDKPKDWRTADKRGPSGARRDTEAAPEGAWGAGSATTVSRQTLVETGAVQEEREPVTVGQWIKRGLLLLLVLGLAVGGWFGLRAYWSTSQQREALAKALEYLKPDAKVKLPVSWWVAELRRVEGEHALRANKPVKDALEAFHRAREPFLQRAGQKGSSENDQDAFLIDLALTQVELGGNQDEIDGKVRLKWEDAVKEVRQTLQCLVSEDARVFALRQVCNKFVAKGQIQPALSLARQLTPDVNNDAPTLAPQVALMMTQVDEQEVAALLPEPRGQAAKTVERLAWAEGKARKGDLKKARAYAQLPGLALDRFRALLAVAAVTVDGPQAAEAREDVEAALKMLASELREARFTEWDLLELYRLGARAGLSEKIEPLARQLPNKALRGRAELELFRARLAETQGQAEESLLKQAFNAKDAAKDPPLAHVLGVEAFARHNTRTGGSAGVMKFLEGLEPETFRPFGYLGVALGVQDAGR